MGYHHKHIRARDYHGFSWRRLVHERHGDPPCSLSIFDKIIWDDPKGFGSHYIRKYREEQRLNAAIIVGAHDWNEQRGSAAWSSDQA